jgi:hypothetical protein
MRNRHDQIGKQIGRAALRTLGVTVVHDEILPEPQYADIRYEPDLGRVRAVDRERLGLLGRIASSLCLIEIYSHAPDAAELRACLLCRTRHNRHYAAWRIMPRGVALSTRMVVGDAA